MAIRNRVVLGLCLLMVAAFAVAYTSSAQSGDSCGTQYDFDGSGRLDKADMYEWLAQARFHGCMYAEVASDACGELDLDGNDYVDDYDLEAPHSVLMGCLPGGGFNVPPAGR